MSSPTDFKHIISLFIHNTINDNISDVKNYTLQSITDKVSKLNNNHVLSRLFEYYTCLKNNVIPWDLLPLDEKEYLANEKGILRDMGVDGLSIDRKISLQAKFRNNSSINYTEASTFNTTSNIIGCDQMILHTLDTSKIHSLIKNIPKMKIKNISRDKFINKIAKILYKYKHKLEESVNDKLVEIEQRIGEIKEEKEKKELDIILRPYQQEAIDIFKNRVEKKEKKTNIQITCAGGKSVMIKFYIQTFVNVINTMGEINVLVLVPSIILCDRMIKMLSRSYNVITSKDIIDGISLTDKVNVYISVYNSIDKIKDINFNLVIIDEAHHLDLKITNNTYRKTIQNLNTDFILNLTATFHKETDIHYNYSLESGIKDGFINDYDIIVPWFKETTSEIDFKNSVYKSLVNLIHTRIDFNYILAYCNNIEESKEFTDILNKNGISTVHMDGEMNIKERNKILSDFELRKYRVLSSVSVLGEGVDLPFVETCIFVYPRNSFINITQCIGRVLRKCNYKYLSHVVFPHMNEQKTLEKFLKVLDKNDSRIIKDDKISRSRVVFIETDDEENNRGNIINKYICDVIHEKYCNIEQLLWDMWIKKYNLLKEFENEYKRQIIQREEYKEIKIGQWYKTQRKLWINNKLNNRRIELLSQLKHHTFGDKELTWNEKYDLVIEFQKIYKRKVKNKDVYKNVKIGSWYINQRTMWNKDMLLDERKKLLLKLEYWENTTQEKLTWEDKLHLLEKFESEFKRKIKQKDEYNGVNIGQWYSDQKRTFSKGKLSDERIKLFSKLRYHKLKEIKLTWKDKYNLLKEFDLKYKRKIYQRDKYENVNLGHWYTQQVNRWREGKLLEDRLKLLNKLEYHKLE